MKTENLEKLQRLANGLWSLKWYDDVCNETNEAYKDFIKEIASLNDQDRAYVYGRFAEMDRAAEERPRYTEH